jgi:hypothetical protein
MIIRNGKGRLHTASLRWMQQEMATLYVRMYCTFEFVSANGDI